MNKWLAGMALGASVGAYAWARTRSNGHPHVPSNQGPHVVILGAGFAGLTLAHRLSRRGAGRVRITLVDRHNYHLFTPMLYQAATCGVTPYDVAYPIRQFAGEHGLRFQMGTITGIDLNARRVQLDNGDLGYDYLAIALGSTTNFFHNAGAQQHALPLKWLEDGVAIRHHIIDRLEQALVTSDENAQRELLTFVIVGGGATGVETAASLADLMHEILPRDYPRLNPLRVRVVLIESEGKLLGHMSDEMAQLAQRQLRTLGVEVWLNTRAQEISANQVTTTDGRTIQARTIIWTTGVQAPEVIASLDAPHGKGGSLAVDDYLQVTEHPDVFALGDSAHLENKPTGKPVPLLAAAAVQEGTAVAENIARAIEGQPQVPFHYHSYGEVVSLGHRAGVAEVGGAVIDGLPGWLAWRAIHLAKITSFRNKLATTLDWSVGYFYNRDIARLEVEPVSGS